MTDPDRLFPVEPIPDAATLGPDARRTLKRRAILESGRHPATGLKLLDPEWKLSCKQCVHLRARWRRVTYWKCAVAGITHGPGSDIRVSWPACTAFRMEATE